MISLLLRRRAQLPVTVLAALSAVTALLITLLAPTQPAQAANAAMTHPADGAGPQLQTAPGVYLYGDRDYGGRSIHLTRSESNLVNLGFNDITSSVRLVGSYRVTLYEHVNFTGARSTIRSNCPWIGGPKVPPVNNIWRPPGCYTQFSSPQEIGNDQVSSLAITGIDSYSLSSRLIWPSGMWINATVGASVGWHFHPDGTYAYSYHDPSGLIQIVGNFLLDRKLYAGLFWLDVIRTYNNQVYRNGIYVGRDPDSIYRYSYKNSGDTISVLIGNTWSNYDFKAS